MSAIPPTQFGGGGAQHSRWERLPMVDAVLIGDRIGDRIGGKERPPGLGGLWRSDHAEVATTPEFEWSLCRSEAPASPRVTVNWLAIIGRLDLKLTPSLFKPEAGVHRSENGESWVAGCP